MRLGRPILLLSLMSDTQVHPVSRVAVVTGAAQGIGEAIALRLADDGFDIVIADLPGKRGQVEAVVRAIEAKGRRALGVFGDVSLEADVVSLVEKTVQELGGLDVVRGILLFASTCRSN